MMLKVVLLTRKDKRFIRFVSLIVNDHMITRSEIEIFFDAKTVIFDGNRICAPATCSIVLFDNDSIDTVSIETNTLLVLMLIFCPTFK